MPRYNAANQVSPEINVKALKLGYHAASPVSPAINVKAQKTSRHPLGNPSAKSAQAQSKKLSYAAMLATKSGLPTPRQGIRERRVLNQLNIKPKLMTPGHKTPSPLAMGRAHKSRHEVPNEFHIEKLQLDIDTKHLKINIQRLLSEYQGPKDFGTLEFAFFLK